jgi:hypothetical protein
MPTSDSASATENHADDDEVSSPDTLAVLLREVGLALSDTELTGVRALRARFAADRRRLAAIDVGDAEPLTVVAPPRLAGA